MTTDWESARAEDRKTAGTLARLESETESRMRRAGLVSLFLDFDGTLAPIEDDPASPQLDPHTAATLKRMTSLDSMVTTIVSGRAVEDLYGRIRLGGLIYAGNHGLEIFGRGLSFVEPDAAALREPLARLCEELTGRLRAFEGVMVEYKGLTASVHFRRAAADPADIEDTVRAAVCRAGGRFRLNLGHKVWEIMPRSGWHKGMAVEWINRQLRRGNDEKMLSLYLGDDSADEDAFSAMPDGITVKVGNESPTLAAHRLPGPEAVDEFLRWLAFRRAAQTHGV